MSKVDGVPRSARDLSIFLLDLASRGGNPVVDPFVGDGAAPAGYSPFEGYVLSVNGLDCEDGPVKRRQSVSHMDKGGVSRTLLEVKVKREHKVRNLLVFVFQLDAGHRRVAFLSARRTTLTSVVGRLRITFCILVRWKLYERIKSPLLAT